MEKDELKLSRILVPIDFSEHSKKALAQAVKLAQRCNAKLFLLHTIPSIKPGYGLERNWEVALRIDKEAALRSSEHLNQIVRTEIPEGVDVTCDISGGNPVEQIVEGAVVQQADLIVMATHGRTGLKHMLLGSVAEGVVRHATCSILVVRTPGQSIIETEKSTHPSRVFVAIDFSPSSERILEAAERWAKLLGAALVITHVAPIHYPISEYGALEAPDLDAELLEVGVRRTADLVNRERGKGLDAFEEVRQGKAGAEILDAAKKYDAQMMIVGTRGLSGLKHMVFGSTAEYIVRHADRPVLVVRNLIEVTQLSEKT